MQYAKDRVQFGRPIGSFQAIKHKCADMLLEVESAKSAAYYGMWCAAEMNDELPSVASLAKSYCSEAYFHTTAENIQIHGGIGFTWEHPAHLYFKRAKSSELLFGDPTYHRELLAQRIGSGAPGPVEAFKQHGVDFVVADTLDELLDGMRALSPDVEIDTENITREVVARDREVDNEFSKDLQLTAVRGARKYRGDKLIRVATPHKILDPAAGPLIAVKLHILTRKSLGGIQTDLDSRALGARERRNGSAVRRDGHDGQLRVEQCLEIRPLAAHEHPDHAATTLPIARSPVSAAGTTAQ